MKNIRFVTHHQPPEIFPMQEADLDNIAALEARVEIFPWTRALFADSLAAGHLAWVARQGSRLAGFLILMSGVDEVHLLNIAVAPEMQGRGYGTFLLQHAFTWAALRGAQRMLLEVRPSNVAALTLYQRQGFTEVGRRKNYYPAAVGREDGLLLSRILVLEVQA
jgi:ribosomal-protein-alanine N-acetyltransferase